MGRRHRGGVSNSGQRFVPATQQWVELPTLSAPAAASSAWRVALGQTLVVFGGTDASGATTADGGLYLLDEDRWIDLPTVGRPSARAFHVCQALDDSRVFIWGGLGGVDFVGRADLRGDGAIFDLTTTNWQAVPAVGAPEPRTSATSVLHHGSVLVFGGQAIDVFRNLVVTGGGALYDVTAGQWRPLPAGAPSARVGAVAIPARDEILVHGGRNDSGALVDGALLDVSAKRWRTLNPRQAPPASLPFAVVDGRAYFWSSGSDDRGAVYVVGDPAIDPDDDGLIDDHELYLGTDPADADSNDDGVSDGDAIAEGLPFLP